MKIALIGYGKMGKNIEQIAVSRGHQIVSIIDVNNPEEFGPNLIPKRKLFPCGLIVQWQRSAGTNQDKKSEKMAVFARQITIPQIFDGSYGSLLSL